MNIDDIIAQATMPDADAQPKSDATIPESAVETNDTESVETPDQANEVEEVWPKKAENALAKAKGKAAQLRAERDQERMARQRLEQQLAQYQSQPQKTNKPDNTGEPKENDFNSYADYMRAVQKYDLEQAFAQRDGKQQETQRVQHEQKWVAEREQVVATQAHTFLKDNPEVADLIEEYGDVIDGWDESHPHITRAFLEADNAPLAFYNLAKEGKLEALMSMSPAKAAMEIGRAQSQTITKPRTKAPTPMPASRGSVSSAKSPDDMNGKEIRSWMRSD